MKIENTEVYGLSAAMRGMRNPMNSWDQSDSYRCDRHVSVENFVIGPKDLALACKLVKAGSSHRKFLRQIMVWVDLTLPRYVLTEIDTYKVATVRNSCSTMHKLGVRDLDKCDFQDEDIPDDLLELINTRAEWYRIAPSPTSLRNIKKILPESFLQKSTFTFNYCTLMSMYFDRKNHRLPEWSGPDGICQWISRLPYMEEFINASL
jgi:hypothetical protein